MPAEDLPGADIGTEVLEHQADSLQSSWWHLINPSAGVDRVTL